MSTEHAPTLTDEARRVDAATTRLDLAHREARDLHHALVLICHHHPHPQMASQVRTGADRLLARGEHLHGLAVNARSRVYPMLASLADDDTDAHARMADTLDVLATDAERAAYALAQTVAEASRALLGGLPSPDDAPAPPPPPSAVADLNACTCVTDCAEHPPTACSLSGEPHVHPDDETGTFGACPVHPDAPGDL